MKYQYVDRSVSAIADTVEEYLNSYDAQVLINNHLEIVSVLSRLEKLESIMTLVV